MNTFLLVSNILIWLVALGLGFLLLGTLRVMGLLSWRLEQLQATTPSRLGRDGLKVGKKAPDFTLPAADGGERSLHDFAGRKVLLVFTQAGCGPCKTIVPELNRLQASGEYQVLVVNNGGVEATGQWAVATSAHFPVLVQEKLNLSKLYEVFATPFAFLIAANGIITSKGLIGSRQHLNYVMTGAGNRSKPDAREAESGGAERQQTGEPIFPKEVTLV